MLFADMRGSRFLQLLKTREFRFAWCVAIVADAIQILILPVFIEGVLSPVDMIVDLATAVILSRLVGWHWAFLPSFLAELIPGLNLFPSWSAALAYVTWQRARSSELIIDVEPLPSRRILKS
jgi:hypothetical protein